MSGRRWGIGAAAMVLLVCASRGASGGDAFQDRLEEARRLTWSTESRSRGIDTLRQLAGERPDAVEPRLELGRALTWNPATRAEGVATLRTLLAQKPDAPEVVEPLAEVLSWDARSRDEAVQLLRSLTTKEPRRVTARLTLAEIVSWEYATRDEAETIYKQVLADEPDSVKARVGLARLQSWEGDLTASMTTYESALRLSPGDAEATTGLADVQRWSGRSLASLKTLGETRGKDSASRDVIRARAAAYANLGMPAKAIEEYRSLLVADPTDTTAQKAVSDLDRQLRPTLHVGGAVSTESGDPGTSKLESTRVPVSFHVGVGGDLALAVFAEGGSYRNDLGSTQATSLGVGLEGALGTRVVLASRIDHNGFEEADDEWTGRLDLRIRASDRVELRVGAESELLAESRLAAVGETIAGTLYGPAARDNVHAGATVRLGKSWDVTVIGSQGKIGGTAIADNDRKTLYGGLGRGFKIGPGWLRAGVSYFHMENDLDLGGFPQTDLAGDGITTRGVGGYFSPFDFTNAMVRVDAAFPAGERVRFHLGAAVGRQRVEDVFTTGSEDTSSEAALGIAWRLGERLTMEARVERMDVAAAFDRTRAGIDWIWAF